MIVEFSASNYRSIYDEQRLSMVAAKLNGRNSCITTTPFTIAPEVLPIALIYGANASGKTNILNALRFMKSAVTSSFKESSEVPRVPRNTFKLIAAASDEPSKFEIVFINDGVLHQYGFECSDTEFVNEWMYVYPRNRRQLWFERDNGEFRFGEKLRGHTKVISELTNSDALFLSVAVSSGHEQLSSVSEYIKSINIELDYAVEASSIISKYQDRDLDPRTLNFLSILGTGITSYEKSTIEMPEELRAKAFKFAKALKELHDDDSEVTEDNTFFKKDVRFYHEGAEEDTLPLRADQESAGSLRLIMLLEAAFEALDTGGVLVVDELDASLHTRACQQIAALFISPKFNIKGAQIIATTHDTNMLSYEKLRRDEVWFVEKDVSGKSVLYSATDFKVREGTNLEKAYLDDRLGGIPPNFDVEFLN